MSVGEVHIPYALAVTILETSSWFVKEVIRLDVYILVIFTTYYDPLPPPWKLVANSMSSCM